MIAKYAEAISQKINEMPKDKEMLWLLQQTHVKVVLIWVGEWLAGHFLAC